MKRSLVRRLNIGFGLTLLLLLLNAVISYRNILKLLENERSVSQTNQTIATLESTLSTLKDAETGQRGYLLTGEERYLKPYNNAIAQINQRLQALKQPAILSSQQFQFLDHSVKAKFAELDQTIQLRRTQGFDAALRVVRAGYGKQIMDDIRQQISAIEAQKYQTLQQRKIESERTFNATLFTFTLVTGTSLLLLWLIATGFKRYHTEQDQAEHKLRESEQQFRATFNQAAVGIAHVSPQGSWLRTNQRLCEIVGYPCSELQTLTFQDITHPEDLERDLTYLHQLLANEIQYYSIEKRYIRKDRSIVWINLTVSLVRRFNGQPKYFISVIEDISDRKAVELALQHLNETLEQRIQQRTAQLTEINQELEAFTYTVSHDLRAPLRIMQGFAQALEEDYSDQLDQVATSYIDNISESAVQMDDLINDLLSYSRLSRTQLQLQPTDLNEVIASALQQLSALLQERNAIVQVPPNLPSVIAHRSTLIQVITNLISNAIKFVEPEIQPNLKISSQIQENSVRLSFVDNGIGIDSKYHDRIFRVFERLHGIESFPGTGIGLAIVRKGLERMGGQVGLESQLGHGSQFWISLLLALESPNP